MPVQYKSWFDLLLAAYQKGRKRQEKKKERSDYCSCWQGTNPSLILTDDDNTHTDKGRKESCYLPPFYTGSTFWNRFELGDFWLPCSLTIQGSINVSKSFAGEINIDCWPYHILRIIHCLVFPSPPKWRMKRRIKSPISIAIYQINRIGSSLAARWRPWRSFLVSQLLFFSQSHTHTPGATD